MPQREEGRQNALVPYDHLCLARFLQKLHSLDELEKVYNEFFYQSEYILKKDGMIALITRLPDIVKTHALKHNFELSKEKEVFSGEQALRMMFFRKKAG